MKVKRQGDRKGRKKYNDRRYLREIYEKGLAGEERKMRRKEKRRMESAC